MTLRLFNPLDERLSPGANDPDSDKSARISLGYPVVDTPEWAGHFCDRAQQGAFPQESIDVMCRSVNVSNHSCKMYQE